jgi:hypothetical protein
MNCLDCSLQHTCEHISEQDNSLSHIVFADEIKCHICGPVNWGKEPPRWHLEHEWNSPKMHVWCMLIYESHWTSFLHQGHHKKQLISRSVGKLCSSTAQQQRSNSSTGQGRPAFWSHCPWLSEHEFPRLMDRKRRTNCMAPSFSRPYTFGLFSLGLCERLHVQPKNECAGWNQTVDQGSNCPLQARFGMYEELQMVLSVKCYISKQFSKKLLQLMHKILQTTPLYLFSAYVSNFEKTENAYEITFLTVYTPKWLLGNGSIKIPLSLLGSGSVETLPR